MELILILKLIIMTIAIYLTSQLLPGIQIKNQSTLFCISLGFSLVNFLLNPLIAAFGIFNILTLGLFCWFINTAIILLLDMLLPTIRLQSLTWAMLFALTNALILSLLTWLLVLFNFNL